MAANSTQNYSGYNLNRNSSKVMAPPGGASSISFGGYEAPKPKAAPAPKPEAAPAAVPAATASVPAAATAAPVPAAATTAPVPAASTAPPAKSAPAANSNMSAGGRVVKKDIFEKEHHVSACQRDRNKSNVFGGSAPATAPKANIRQPPGGSSSITFG